MNHYGSGYASFLDVFVYPKDDSTKVSSSHDKYVEYVGIIILLSRLGNFYTLGKGNKSWNDKGSASYLPSSEMDDNFSEAGFKAPLQIIKNILNNNGVEEVSMAQLQAPLNKTLSVQTILSDRPWKQFDALYYWMD